MTLSISHFSENKIKEKENDKLTLNISKSFKTIKKKIKKKVNKIFKNIDNDNNGFIEYEEFARAALDKRIFLDENVLKYLLI